MANTWKYAFALGLVGSALAAGCVVNEGDGDGAGGASGEAGSGGTGGTAGKGGSGGSSGKGGASGKGGSSGKGGAAGSGTSGGSAGTGMGGDGGMSGSDTGGTGGTGGTDMVILCEDLEGTTPYPNCTAEANNDCSACIETSCCEESMACYSTDPYNACGWGGPADGEYSGAGEIGCYIECLKNYVGMNDGICDNAGITECTDMCTTDCSLIPDAMNDMVACVNANCAFDCFVADADSCGD
jgi:hypothetical protein